MRTLRALLIAVLAAASTAGVALASAAPKAATPPSPPADTARADTAHAGSTSAARSPARARADSLLRELRTHRVFTPVGPAYDVAPNPGPLLPPGSPIANRYTIAPGPIPGDLGGEASQRMKVMNVPRRGSVILLSPLPDTTRLGAGSGFQLH